VTEEVEEAWDEAWLYESDKAWDAIHRCLTDGRLELENGSPPLNLVVFGGEQLYTRGDYYVCFVSKPLVCAVASALKGYSHSDFETAYARLAATSYAGPINADDMEYTWEHLEGLKGFFAKAARAGRSVVFTVDQ